MADNAAFEGDSERGETEAEAAEAETEAGAPQPCPPPAPAARPSRLLRLVTVEPLVLAYFATTSLSALGAQSLTVSKACWPERAEAPQPGDDSCADERRAQQVVTAIDAWKPALMHALPLLLLPLAGAWSDARAGRRAPLVLLPLAGRLAADACLLANALCWGWPPEGAALAEALPYGLSGGVGVLNIGVTGYITDVTGPGSRTVRLGVVTACVLLGSPIGLALGGALSGGRAGLAGLFGAGAAIDGCALLYGAVRLRRRRLQAQLQAQPQAQLQTGCCGPLASALRVAARPRPGAGRCCLLLLLAATPCVVGPLIGESAVLFLFARLKFSWTPLDYGLFASFKMSVMVAGTVAAMAMLCHWLKVDDAKIGMAACSLQVLACVTYAYVNVGWMMYIVPLLEMMYGAGIAVHKSIVSKLIPQSEMGQVTALLSINEALVPLLIRPAYSLLYQNTLAAMPGAFYLLGAGLALPGVLAFGRILEGQGHGQCVVYGPPLASGSNIPTEETKGSLQRLIMFG